MATIYHENADCCRAPMSGDCSVSDHCDNSVAIYEANEDDLETMETETIVEEFVRLKLKQNTGIIQRRRTSTDMETQALIGRLIEISNELEAQYGERLNRDAEMWIKSATYDKFLQIAKGVFSDGVINWSRIVVLFMFAVKVVFNAVSQGFSGLAGDVIRFVVKFIFIHGIYKWIQSHGGWVAVLREYTPHSNSSGLIVFGLTLLIVCLLLSRKI